MNVNIVSLQSTLYLYSQHCISAVNIVSLQSTLYLYSQHCISTVNIVLRCTEPWMSTLY